jgi:hypothetical protein
MRPGGDLPSESQKVPPKASRKTSSGARSGVLKPRLAGPAGGACGVQTPTRRSCRASPHGSSPLRRRSVPRASWIAFSASSQSSSGISGNVSRGAARGDDGPGTRTMTSAIPSGVSWGRSSSRWREGGMRTCFLTAIMLVIPQGSRRPRARSLRCPISLYPRNLRGRATAAREGHPGASSPQRRRGRLSASRSSGGGRPLALRAASMGLRGPTRRMVASSGEPPSRGDLQLAITGLVLQPKSTSILPCVSAWILVQVAGHATIAFGSVGLS